MSRFGIGLGLALFSVVALAQRGAAADDAAPWDYTACCDDCCDQCGCDCCDDDYTPPLFGDLTFGGGQQQGQQGQFQQGQFQQGQLQQGQFQQAQQQQGQFQQAQQQQGQFQQGQFQGLQGQQLQQIIAIPVSKGALKIGENESPRPVNRVFGAYNYYDNVHRAVDVHQETVGCELTYLEGSGSLGLRLPFYQARDDFGADDSIVGDLSVILKHVVAEDPDTGSLCSAGLMVTAPTGPNPDFITFESGQLQEVHSTLLQPFLGYICGADGDVFLHGFSSVMAPSDSRDVTVLFNDVGIGCWAYRDDGDRGLTGVIPTFELHVNTPLNHRGEDELVRFHDSVDLTGGVHFRFGRSTSLGVGVGTQVTGPQLFDVEALVNFNLGL